MPPTNHSSSTSKPSAMDRYHEAPRAVKWAIWATVGVVLYLGVIDPALVLTQKYDAVAEKNMGLIRTIGRGSTDLGAIVESGRKTWGDILLPGDHQRATDAQSRIASVLAANGIRSDIRRTTETQVKLGVPFNGQDESRIAKVRSTSFTVQFTASPDVLTSVLADLETQPEIARISSVRLTRARRRTVLEVTIVVEAWMIEDPQEKGRG